MTAQRFVALVVAFESAVKQLGFSAEAKAEIDLALTPAPTPLQRAELPTDLVRIGPDAQQLARAERRARQAYDRAVEMGRSPLHAALVPADLARTDDDPQAVVDVVDTALSATRHHR